MFESCVSANCKSYQGGKNFTQRRPGRRDRRARVEAELLRITCKKTFLRRQQGRPLHGIFAFNNGEDGDADGCSSEVDVASGPGADRSSCFEIPLSCFWLDSQI